MFEIVRILFIGRAASLESEVATCHTGLPEVLVVALCGRAAQHLRGGFEVLIAQVLSCNNARSP